MKHFLVLLLLLTGLCGSRVYCQNTAVQSVSTTTVQDNNLGTFPVQMTQWKITPLNAQRVKENTTHSIVSAHLLPSSILESATLHVSSGILFHMRYTSEIETVKPGRIQSLSFVAVVKKTDPSLGIRGVVDINLRTENTSTVIAHASYAGNAVVITAQNGRSLVCHELAATKCSSEYTFELTPIPGTEFLTSRVITVVNQENQEACNTLAITASDANGTGIFGIIPLAVKEKYDPNGKREVRNSLLNTHMVDVPMQRTCSSVRNQSCGGSINIYSTQAALKTIEEASPTLCPACSNSVPVVKRGGFSFIPIYTPDGRVNPEVRTLLAGTPDIFSIAPLDQLLAAHVAAIWIGLEKEAGGINPKLYSDFLYKPISCLGIPSTDTKVLIELLSDAITAVYASYPENQKEEILMRLSSIIN